VAGSRPRLCVALTHDDTETAASVAPLTDFYEVRIDLIGPDWREVARRLEKPWIATNRRREEGGAWQGGEAERIEVLLQALDMGPAMIDIELAAPALSDVMSLVKGNVRCLVSHHDAEKTPPLEEMKDIVERMLAAGADVCKVVTTARALEDNITVLKLLRAFPGVDVVAFAMEEAGKLSRVLSPLAGGYFTFAAAAAGSESAPGQMTAGAMRELYKAMGHG
jgi:3-dehydroquinate dehydratase-1